MNRALYPKAKYPDGHPKLANSISNLGNAYQAAGERGAAQTLLREALDMTRELRPFNLRWLEEPVWPPENYSGLARIRREGGIPIAAGENASTLMDFQHLLEAKAVDFIQPSPALRGTAIAPFFGMMSSP